MRRPKASVNVALTLPSPSVDNTRRRFVSPSKLWGTLWLNVLGAPPGAWEKITRPRLS